MGEGRRGEKRERGDEGIKLQLDRIQCNLPKAVKTAVVHKSLSVPCLFLLEVLEVGKHSVVDPPHVQVGAGREVESLRRGDIQSFGP